MDISDISCGVSGAPKGTESPFGRMREALRKSNQGKMVYNHLDPTIASCRISATSNLCWCTYSLSLRGRVACLLMVQKGLPLTALTVKGGRFDRDKLCRVAKRVDMQSRSDLVSTRICAGCPAISP